MEENSSRRKSKATVNLKTGRFDNIDSAFQFCTNLLALMMMIAESMMSNRPVLRFTEALLFLLK